ncbi:MAG: CarD family transcriptional regulator [Treponema sp.]|uniref:CarD family transcriptional regulator n=1 Tax=Treponema sp. TaxID=166 RepID=UPI001D626243|nr:CarD family transcriptional regulator [Treponema sp.]MBS7311287.1 CarD family transcriptional regulator [Treponema sp.]MCI5696139.1 CarD family transcriptional regulator [Spirochaetia bacterium]MDD5810618.1 CarD family transcriptional regulator [Treponema sp.]MDY5886237.1 CarD family transcriptional regulator [Treponema sp.]
MAKSRIKTEFKVNQQIVYPSQGVGKITEIFEKEFNGETVAYYKIYLEVSDMIVMVPVNNAKDLGIRAIVEASEAKKALNMLSEDFEPITSDWKLRYQMNLELLKKGSIADIAQIVRCLYNRSKVKELPIQERKLYDSAKKLLEDEISFALGKSAKDIEAMIHEKLEPPGAAQKVKHIIAQDDDDDDDFDMGDEEEDKKRRRSRDDDDDDDDSDEETESLDDTEEDFDEDDDYE